MRYGFDKHGGFWVVDDIHGFGNYSYPGSINAEAAAKNPAKWASFIFNGLAAGLRGLPADIIERQYQRGVEALKEIES